MLMKKLFSMLLVLYLLGSGVCIAADTKAVQNPTVISMDNIGQIWMDKSQDLIKYKSELTLAEDTLDDLSDDVDKMTDAPFGSIDMSTYNSLWNNRDQADLSNQLAKERYQQNIQNAQLAAKKVFLACWQDEVNVNATKSSLVLKENQLKGYEVLLMQGYISQYQYNDMKTSVESLKENLENLKLQQVTDQVLLKSKLGLNIDSDVALTYPELSKEGIAKLMEIDYSADLVVYMKNSINLKVLQLTYESKENKPYASYAQGQDAKVDLELAKTSLPNNLKLAYNNLMVQYKDLKNSYTTLSHEKDNYNKSHSKYVLGVSSFMDSANAELSYVSVEAQVKGKEISLYNTYLAYLNMVAGN
jgi:outer membrane protein TolC